MTDYTMTLADTQILSQQRGNHVEELAVRRDETVSSEIEMKTLMLVAPAQAPRAVGDLDKEHTTPVVDELAGRGEAGGPASENNYVETGRNRQGPRLRPVILHRIALALVVAAFLPVSVSAKTGYGYKKSEDPLILGVKKIILDARGGDWSSARGEWARLGWQFREFRDDLGIDIGGRMERAIRSQSMSDLAREISRLLYYAVVQKFLWNERERCERYVPAKSRVEAALFYYEEILSIGVRDHDRSRRSEIHRRILDAFKSLRKSIGSPGLFGIGGREPDLQAFRTQAEAILTHLTEVYPFVVVKRDAAAGKGAPPDPSKGQGDGDGRTP